MIGEQLFVQKDDRQDGREYREKIDENRCPDGADGLNCRIPSQDRQDRYGYRRVGTNYLDMVEEDRKAKASLALWSQVETPCGMHIFLEQEMASGRIAFLETIGLPVINDQVTSPLILFQSNEISRDCIKVSSEDDLIKYIRVAERFYFDIGAGISDFKD